MRIVADAISIDPALSADVLRLANSALFGARHAVPGVLHAIVMLGLERVKTLVITAAFMRFATPHCDPGVQKRCWRHSVASALIADEFSHYTNIDRDAAYTAGILHDIGRFALLRLWPKTYQAILDSAVPGDLSVLDWEREAFGMDHTDAADFLLRTWDFPLQLISAAKQHHDCVRASKREPSGILQFACLTADALGFAAHGGHGETTEGVPAAVSDWVAGGPEQLHLRVATRMNALEVWL